MHTSLLLNAGTRGSLGTLHAPDYFITNSSVLLPDPGGPYKLPIALRMLEFFISQRGLLLFGRREHSKQSLARYACHTALSPMGFAAFALWEQLLMKKKQRYRVVIPALNGGHAQRTPRQIILVAGSCPTGCAAHHPSSSVSPPPSPPYRPLT